MNIDNRITLTKTLSNPDEFNHNITQFRNDVSSLILQELNLEDFIYKYSTIYSEDYIEQLRFTLLEMREELIAQKMLCENLEYSTIFQTSFNQSGLFLQYDPKYYKDPKTNYTFTRDSLLSVNLKAAALQLPILDKDTATIKNIAFSNIPVDKSLVSSTKQSVYLYQNTPDACNLDVLVRLNSITEINNITFNINSEFPVTLSKIGYYNNGVYTELSNVNLENLTGYVSMPLYLNNVNIEADAVLLKFILPYCKATNRLYNVSTIQELLQKLIGTSEYIELDNYTSGEYSSYVFHFGIDDIELSKITYQTEGIFIGQPKKFKEPAHFKIRVDQQSSNVGIEYYLFITDYDSKGNKLFGSTKLIPILIDGQTSVVREVIKFVNNKAILNFYPDDIENVSLYCDDVVVAEFNLSGKTITLTGTNDSSIYTVSYIPFHLTKDYVTPLVNPQTTVEYEHEFIYDNNNECKVLITTDEGGVKTIAETTPNNEDGISYIKMVLPYAYDPTKAITIKRYLNNNKNLLDDAAPVFYMSGENQNVFIVGRILYLPFNSSLYPKLTTSLYIVKGTLLNISVTDDVLLYYGKDNSLIINYDAFAALYGSTYSYTLINPVIIARLQDLTNTETFLNLKKFYLYSNTFNDYIQNPKILIET